jgi:hypothetical protein
MKKIFAPVAVILLFAGCYTQFAYVNRPPIEGAPDDSVVASDSAQAHIRDTLPANPNQVCYWTRDMWGKPQLVCEDADYGRDWYRYNNYPWWNSADPYFYGSYNYYGWDERCPAYYYYDYSCGRCRYYSGYDGPRNSWWWDKPSVSGRVTGSSSQTSHARRSRSVGVPLQQGSSPVPLDKSGSVTSSPSGASDGGGQGGGSASGTGHARRVRSGGIPLQSQPSVGQELPKQQPQEQSRPPEQPREQQVQPPPQQQSSPPPSQSPNDGRGNQQDQNHNNDNSSHERRNPRSF